MTDRESSAEGYPCVPQQNVSVCALRAPALWKKTPASLLLWGLFRSSLFPQREHVEGVTCGNSHPLFSVDHIAHRAVGDHAPESLSPEYVTGFCIQNVEVAFPVAGKE